MSEKPISPLRRRMLDDMNMRRFVPDTQREYIRAVKRLATFLGRSPDSATAEELRAFQLHLTETGAQPPSINATVTARDHGAAWRHTNRGHVSPLQPCLPSQSGSTPHERGHDITHPHRQARSSLVPPRPRRRSTRKLPGSTFHSAILPESHRHHCSSEPETHQRPPSPDRHALVPCFRRQNRDQIAIARASPSATHLPPVPSLEALGRRPRCKPNRRDGRHPKPFTATDIQRVNNS
jgi:Phage integrase, N-terminal SAM-like domain